MDIYSVAKEKTKQLTIMLNEQDIDFLFILSREGSDQILPFLTGEDAIHIAGCFFCKSGEHIALASTSDYEKYNGIGIFSKVIDYQSDITAVIQEQFQRLAPKKIALNISTSDSGADGLTFGLFQMLENVLGSEYLKGLWVSSESLIRELRSIKTKTEVEYLKQSIDITTMIYDEVMGRIRCGMSEREIGDMFIEGLQRHNVVNGIGDAYSYPIVCIVRAGLAHRSPGNTKLVPGDILICDFSVRHKGYVSDIARTAYVLKPGETKPPKDIQHAFETAYNAITETINYIAAGRKGFEVDAVGRKVVEDGGFPTVRHSVGHPIGIECHDSGTRLGPIKSPPADNSDVQRTIRLNETYAIEPTVIQDDGLPCMLVEENVVIQENGAHILSRRQEQLYLISPDE